MIPNVMPPSSYSCEMQALRPHSRYLVAGALRVADPRGELDDVARHHGVDVARVLDAGVSFAVVVQPTNEYGMSPWHCAAVNGGAGGGFGNGVGRGVGVGWTALAVSRLTSRSMTNRSRQYCCDLGRQSAARGSSRCPTTTIGTGGAVVFEPGSRVWYSSLGTSGVRCGPAAGT